MQFPGDDGGAQCVMMVHRRKCYFFRPGGKSAAKNAMRQMERSGWDEYDSVIYFLNDGELTGARMLLKNTKRIACVFSARMKHRYEKMTHDLTLNGVNSVLK